MGEPRRAEPHLRELETVALLEQHVLARDFQPVEFQLAVVRVREATYFGMLFIFSPKSPVPSIAGQAAANPS